MGTCALAAVDTTTQGSWVGVYGSDGYDVSQDAHSYPAYVTVTETGFSNFNPGTTASTKGLQEASNHSIRTQGVWFTSTNMTLDLALTSGSHQVACYFWDFDNSGRTINVQVLDVDNANALLFTRTFSSLSATPVWVVWNFSGHIAIKITNAGGPNCVLNEFFFDPVTRSPVAPSATATFLGSDTSTQGNWVGVYGSDGYSIVGDTSSYPAYASVTPGGSSFVHSDPSANVKDLQKASNHATRISAALFNASTFTVTLTLTGGTHKISAYVFDFDSADVRSETLQMFDGTTGMALEPPRSVTAFNTTPRYLQWNCSGTIVLIVTSIAGFGVNCLLNGFFFDPSSSGASVNPIIFVVT
jgi:hypothetical protein